MFAVRSLASRSLAGLSCACRRASLLVGSHGTSRSASQQTADPADKSRMYPDEPRVGIGVVALRPGRSHTQSPEVLLIKRGKEPSKGMWSFPGGSLELGESMIDCAMRELDEETGLKLLNSPGKHSPRSLRTPVAYAAVDIITPDKLDPHKVAFHYVIVEVAGLLENPDQVPVPAGDVDEAKWVATSDLSTWPGLVPNIKAMVNQALERFDVE